MASAALRNSLAACPDERSNPVTTSDVNVAMCLRQAMEDTTPKTKLLHVALAWKVKEPYAHRMLHGVDPMNAERLEVIAAELPDLFDAFVCRLREARGGVRLRIAKLLAEVIEELVGAPDAAFKQRRMAKAKL